METDNKKDLVQSKPEPAGPFGEDSKRMLDEQMLAILRSQAGTPQKSGYVNQAPRPRQTRNSVSRKCTNSSSGHTRQ